MLARLDLVYKSQPVPDTLAQVDLDLSSLTYVSLLSPPLVLSYLRVPASPSTKLDQPGLSRPPSTPGDKVDRSVKAPSPQSP